MVLLSVITPYSWKLFAARRAIALKEKIQENRRESHSICCSTSHCHKRVRNLNLCIFADPLELTCDTAAVCAGLISQS